MKHKIKTSTANKLIKSAQGHNGLFIFSLFFMFLSGLANVLPSWLIKVAVDGLAALNTKQSEFCLIPQQLISWFSNVFSTQTIQELFYVPTTKLINFLPILIIIVFSLDAVFKFCYLYSIRIWGLKIVKKLRERYHQHLNLLSFEDQRRYDSGSLVSVVSSDLHSLQSWLAESVTNLFNDGFKALFLFLWLLILNYKLTLIAIVTIPLFAIPVIKLGKYIRSYSKSGQDFIGRIGSFLAETIANQSIVKAFNLQNWRQEQFLEESQSLFKLQSKWFLFMSLVSPITNIIAAVSIAAILYFGLRSVGQNSVSLGEFSSFFVTSILLYDPVKRLGRVTTIIQSAIGVADRVFDILDQPIQEHTYIKQNETNIIPSKNNLKSKINAENSNYSESKSQTSSDDNQSLLKLPGKSKLGIKLHELDFKYPSTNEYIFKNFNLDLKPNSEIAIVGPSGSGKSTLIALLLRFYEIQQGKILLYRDENTPAEHLDINKMSLNELRSNFALVTQNPALFSGSIRQNICLDQTISEENLKQALAKAYLDDVIANLPKGLDTDIGELGSKLSLGQRQRVALARAFVSEAPIVIFDEPTSALDNKSQDVVQKAIRNLVLDRTAIIIAHRLNTIEDIDNIIYLENGKVLEYGNHQELINKQGAYYRLYNSG
jgi:subfamily B ATP-binding cassette protein MsbA